MGPAAWRKFYARRAALNNALPISGGHGMDHQIFELPGFTNQAGATLDLKVAYKTRGRLSSGRNNAIVVFRAA